MDVGVKLKFGDQLFCGVKLGVGVKVQYWVKFVLVKLLVLVDLVIVVIGKLQWKFLCVFLKNLVFKVLFKVGIWDDFVCEVQVVGFSEVELCEVMLMWCCGNCYWFCFVEDVVCVDLQGNEVGCVMYDDVVCVCCLKVCCLNKGVVQLVKGVLQQLKVEQQVEVVVVL